MYFKDVLWNVSASILVAGHRVELFSKKPWTIIYLQHFITSQDLNLFLYKFLLAICSIICQLKLGQYIKYFLRNFSVQKVKKHIFKGHKHPAEASISRVEFIFFIHLTNRKIFFLLQTETHTTYRMRPNVGKVVPNRRGKMACLQGTLLLHSSYNTLPKNYKPSWDIEWLYRFFIILEGTPKPFYVFHNELNKTH